MEAQVKHWMLNTPRVRNLTKVTMKKLFETEPRQFDTKKFELQRRDKNLVNLARSQRTRLQP